MSTAAQIAYGVIAVVVWVAYMKRLTRIRPNYEPGDAYIGTLEAAFLALVWPVTIPLVYAYFRFKQRRRR